MKQFTVFEAGGGWGVADWWKLAEITQQDEPHPGDKQSVEAVPEALLYTPNLVYYQCPLKATVENVTVDEMLQRLPANIAGGHVRFGHRGHVLLFSLEVPDEFQG